MEITETTGVKEIVPGVGGGGVEGYIRFHFEQEEEEQIQVIHFDCLSQKKEKIEAKHYRSVKNVL